MKTKALKLNLFCFATIFALSAVANLDSKVAKIVTPKKVSKSSESQPLILADGGIHGGGGDATEMGVDLIRDNISKWIRGGGALSIKKFPNNVDAKKYIARMTQVLKKGQVIVTFVTTEQEEKTNDPEQKVKINGNYKSCRTFESQKDFLIHMLCNVERYPKDGPGQYRLIHHEFAGIYGLELNVGADSDYTISIQLTDLLLPEIIYRLPIVTKSTAPTAPISHTVVGKYGPLLNYVSIDDKLNCEQNVSNIKNILEDNIKVFTEHAEARTLYMKNYNNSSGRSQMANRLLELAKLGRPGGLYEKFYKDTAFYLVTSCINDTGYTCNIADDIKTVSVDSSIHTKERELLVWLKQVSTDLATSPSDSVKKIVCQDFNDNFKKLNNTFSNENINLPVAVESTVAKMYFDLEKLPRVSYDLHPDSRGITFTDDYSKQLLNLLSTSVYADKKIALSLFDDADIYRKLLDGSDAGGRSLTLEFIELSIFEKEDYLSYNKEENILTYHGNLRNSQSGGNMIDVGYTNDEIANFLRKNLR